MEIRLKKARTFLCLCNRAASRILPSFPPLRFFAGFTEFHQLHVALHPDLFYRKMIPARHLCTTITKAVAVHTCACLAFIAGSSFLTIEYRRLAHIAFFYHLYHYCIVV